MFGHTQRTDLLLRKSPKVLATLALATLAPLASPAGARGDRDLPVRESASRRFELTFPHPSEPGAVDIDNWWGPVTVIAADTDVVSVELVETVLAEDREALARARAEVHLDTTADPGHNAVRLYVDGPFRCEGERNDGSRWRRGREPGDDVAKLDELDSSCRRQRRSFGDDYVVRHALTVHVPRQADVIVSTINDGDVEARGLAGRYRITNVNGNVTLVDVRGPAPGPAGAAAKGSRAVTVNGELRASFVTRPAGELELGTVNGDVDLSFPRDLAADFTFETLNGEIASDFPYTQLPQAAAVAERQGSRYVYRSSRPSVRIGNGGPRVAVSTVNGDILIRRQP